MDIATSIRFVPPYAGRLPQLSQHAGPRTCSRVVDGAVADCRCPSLTSSGDADGEEGGPEFSGDQDAVSGRVIGDAVEHGFFLRVDLTGWEDTCQVDLVSRKLVDFRLNPLNLGKDCVGIGGPSEGLQSAFQLAM